METVTKNCLQCGVEFSYFKGGGAGSGSGSMTDQKYCSKECRLQFIRDIPKLHPELLKDCKTEGCLNKANRTGAGLCEACYGRMRRKGTVDYSNINVPYRTVQSAGYLRLREQNHVLSDSTGSVYEHRFVYHKHFGDGPFKCNWCGKEVNWFDMHIDHLDDNVTNNNIENLVASCPTCNQHRGFQKMCKTQRAKGTQLTYNGKTMCVSEWAVEVGITVASLQYRLKHGWSIERALSEPRGVTGPQRGWVGGAE